MREKFGQHFLINKTAVSKIIAALDLGKNDTIIEIGPGTGALTIPLAENCEKIGCSIVAIEKDPKLGHGVKGLGYSKILKVEIGDVLKLLPGIIKPHTLNPIPYKVVGNIPYYITGKLLRIFGELDKKPILAVLTVQEEVAERLSAAPPKMNLLAASVQIWARPEIIGRLSPSDFSPSPEVRSAIIKLTLDEKNVDLKKYFRIIKAVFKQPRKMVLNNLSTPLDKLGAGVFWPKDQVLEMIKKVGLTGQERPQNLSLSTLIKLSTLI